MTRYDLAQDVAHECDAPDVSASPQRTVGRPQDCLCSAEAVSAVLALDEEGVSALERATKRYYIDGCIWVGVWLEVHEVHAKAVSRGYTGNTRCLSQVMVLLVNTGKCLLTAFGDHGHNNGYCPSVGCRNDRPRTGGYTRSLVVGRAIRRSTMLGVIGVDTFRSIFCGLLRE